MKKIVDAKYILHTLGIALLFESLFLLLGIFVSAIYKGDDFLPILSAFLITAITGFLLFTLTFKNSKKEPCAKESYMIVAISWLLISLFGTLPYLLSGAIPRFTDAFFESVSGFTTTGASILTDIEALPKGILFWRSETHWIGGMGIIVLVVAVFPFYSLGGNQLFSAESSFMSYERLKPRIVDIAKRLWAIYILLTVLEVIMLRIGGMDLFDGICHSFGTIATGGFSTKNASLMNYSAYIQYVVTLFMFLSGANFALHYFALHGQFRKAIKNEEFRVYFVIILFSTALIMFYLVSASYKVGESFRHALFQVVSILTATGFSTADYLVWPTRAWVVIFILMFVGACVGSTGGGIKVSRHIILFKNIFRFFKDILHPNSVNLVRYNGKTVNRQFVRGIQRFAFLYLIIFAFGTLFMSFLGLDLDSSMGGVITCMGGIGPGLGTVGPASNFSMVPGTGKIFLSFMMIIGRLEIYSFLMIFMPSFWKI